MENETGPVDLGDAVYFKGKTLREQTHWLIACSKVLLHSHLEYFYPRCVGKAGGGA